MRALIIAALLSTMPAHAATRADVEREISGAFRASEIDSRERWALAFTLLATAADVYTSERGQRGGSVSLARSMAITPTRPTTSFRRWLLPECRCGHTVGRVCLTLIGSGGSTARFG